MAKAIKGKKIVFEATNLQQLFKNILNAKYVDMDKDAMEIHGDVAFQFREHWMNICGEYIINEESVKDVAEMLEAIADELTWKLIR